MKRTSCTLLITVLTVATWSMAQHQHEPSAKAQARIVKEVRHELLMLPYFGVFDNIVFKVDEWSPFPVTSSGRVFGSL